MEEAARAYVETTIPSAYVTTREDAGSVFRRQVTREWWQLQRANYSLVTSEAVVLELEQGDWPGQSEAIGLVGGLPRVAIDDEVLGVAQRYVAEKLVPRSIGGDALHLAAACVHEVEFLLTWNIRHLANPNKTDHLAAVNRRLGLLAPQIVTPEALWQESTR